MEVVEWLMSILAKVGLCFLVRFEVNDRQRHLKSTADSPLPITGYAVVMSLNNQFKS